MKHEIDDLMKSRRMDAILVTGGLMHNPSMVYWTGVANCLNADLIKIQDQEPVLFHSVIERDEAERTGLRTICYTKYDWNGLLELANNNLHHARALRYQKMFEDVGISAGMRVAIYGRVEFHSFLPVISWLLKLMPEIEFLLDDDGDIIQTAKQTKDIEEIARIKAVAVKAVAIVDTVKDYLSERVVQDNILYDETGKPLTIGKIHSMINRLVAEHSLETPDGFIFSIGRDAGFPHNSGNSDDLIRLGKTIIFDFYPCERGGGYFFDFTRTWCLGYADDETVSAYQTVKRAFYSILDGIQLNTHFYDYQKLVCEFFEGEGYPSVLSSPQTQVGYNHGLGHGVGLNIHETPLCRASSGEDDLIRANSIITVEPGLYFPEKEMGVRLENTFHVNTNGELEPLVEYSDELIIPMKAGK